MITSFIVIYASKNLKIHFKTDQIAKEKFSFLTRTLMCGKVQRMRNIPYYVKEKEDSLLELQFKGKVQRTENIPSYVNEKPLEYQFKGKVLKTINILSYI